MRRHLHAWLFALCVVVIAVCLAALSSRFGFTSDWSAGQRATLTQQSRALLADLNGPLQVTAYARPGALRAKTRLLIARYQRFKPDLTLAFVDPDLDPVATQNADIQADGELVLGWHGHSQHVTQLDEQTFSDALARLQRGPAALVAFITGAGERAANGTTAADLGDFTRALSARGVRVLPLNLAQAAEVPRNARLVVLADPQAALLPGSVQKLVDWIDNGGNLLWLTSPGSDDLGLAPLAQALGIKRLPGTLVDLAGGARDPRLLIATTYPAQAITQGLNVNTLFPQAVALATLGSKQWQTQSFLESGPQSWNAGGVIDPAHLGYDAGSGALKGPLSFGYALTRLSPTPDHNEQRVAVIGNGAFLSNAFLDKAGNRALGERVFDWLLGDAALAALPAAAPDRVLKPTPLEVGALSFGYLIVLPLALILIGLAIGWRRRRR